MAQTLADQRAEWGERIGEIGDTLRAESETNEEAALTLASDLLLALLRLFGDQLGEDAARGDHGSRLFDLVVGTHTLPLTWSSPLVHLCATRPSTGWPTPATRSSSKARAIANGSHHRTEPCSNRRRCLTRQPQTATQPSTGRTPGQMTVAMGGQKTLAIDTGVGRPRGLDGADRGRHRVAADPRSDRMPFVARLGPHVAGSATTFRPLIGAVGGRPIILE